MDISVIIPCSKNHIKYLEELFDSLQKQNYNGEWEVVLVIDNSNEGKNAAMKIENKYKLNIKILYSEKVTPSENRNIALQNASGKFIAFIDSDCVTFPEWLSGIAEKLSNYDGVQGIDYSYDNSPMGKFLESKQIEFLKNSIENGKCKFIDTKNFAVRSEVIRKVGGFDENLQTSEDIDLGFRIYKSNFNVILNEKMIVLHRWNKGTVWGFFKWGTWYGKGDYNFSKKWNNYDVVAQIKDANRNIHSSFINLIKALISHGEMKSVHLLFSVRELGVACGKSEMIVKNLLSFSK